MRGLSPGTQRVFTLSEGQRIHFGLSMSDVLPCVTSLKSVPQVLDTLDRCAFKKYFVESDRRCWLIRSHEENLSNQLIAYLSQIQPGDRDTSTCRNRNPWYRFQIQPRSEILYSSGFVCFGPKVLINEVGAIAVGAVQGIHSAINIDRYHLRNYLSTIDFESRVVAHAGTLRKIEVNQMNHVLNKYFERFLLMK
jgi:hypothetical protein